MTNQPSFFTELKRRNVLRAATFYAASAWLIVQIATQVFPFFHIAEWVVRWIVVAAVIGFPFAMLFSWFYEWTPHGIQRESDVAPEESIRHETGRTLDRLIIVVLGVAVVLLLTNQLVLRRSDNSDGSGPGSTSIPDKSIAVMPLANVGGNKDEQYFSDGLSEDLITALAQFGGLKVTSRNSSFQFRDSKDDAAAIGKKLGVAHLLEGSVQRDGDTVRIRAELVHAADGIAVWTQHYDRPYKDLFKLQDEITGAVAAALKTRLLPEAGTVVQNDHPSSGNLDAYGAFKQGNLHSAQDTEVDYSIALERYREATRLDPRYVQAYAALSASETTLAAEYYGGEQARQTFATAREDAQAALAIDADSAPAHRALGLLSAWADLDWKRAEAEYRRAVQLAPTDAGAQIDYASMLAAVGRTGEAIDVTRKALETDPLNVFGLSYYALYLTYAGRLEEAEQAGRKAIALQPESLIANWALITTLVLRNETDAARGFAGRVPAGSLGDWLQAEVEQAAGNREAADAMLKTLVEKEGGVSAMQIAEIYAQRKEPDRMFEWLERAWTNRDPGLSFLLYDSFLRPYQSDPRFGAFCRKIGLPVPGNAARASAVRSDAMDRNEGGTAPVSGKPS